MKTSLPLLSSLLLLLFAGPALAKDYLLPKDGNAIVIELSTSEFTGMGQLRLDPVVQIQADGRVRVEGKETAGRLSKAQLQDLLRFMIEEQKFLEHDDDAVGREIDKRPVGVCGTGAHETFVGLVIEGHRGGARQLMLDTFAQARPDIAMLARLQAVAARLRLEGRLAQAGGRDRVEGWWKRANARLSERHPTETPFALDDFQGLKDVPRSVSPLAKGADPNVPKVHGRCAHFVKYVGEPQRMLTAYVRTSGEPLAAVSRR